MINHSWLALQVAQVTPPYNLPLTFSDVRPKARAASKSEHGAESLSAASADLQPALERSALAAALSIYSC